jgi:hypothetical protein
MYQFIVKKINIKNSIIQVIPVILFSWLFASIFLPTHVNSQDLNWSQPINLTKNESQSTSPSLADDPFGGLHLVWQEEEDKDHTAIMYSHLEDGQWSQPVDIFVSTFIGQVGYPLIACDSNGNLHIVYRDTGKGIIYSSANATNAGSARNWQEPSVIIPTQNNLSNVDLYIGTNDQIHVVYAIEIGEGSGIYYIISNDNGDNWQDPIAVYLNQNATLRVTQPQISVDDQNKRHVTWVETGYPETFPPLGIRYSNSLDGLLWNAKLDLANGPYTDQQMEAYGDHEVHVVWSGTTNDRRKFNRHTEDGGSSWSSIFRNDELGGLHGLPSLVFDSNGKLYWLTSGGYYGANNVPVSTGFLFEYVFDQNTWSQGTLLMITPSDVTEENLSNVSAAIVLGNELHVVAQDPRRLPDGNSQFDLFYMFSLLNSPRTIEQQPLATATQILATPTRKPTPNITVTSPITNTSLSKTSFSLTSWQIILISLIPVIIMVLLFIIINTQKKDDPPSLRK